MHALKILITPPSTSSTPPATARLDEDTSSELTEELSISESELDTIVAEDPRDIIKPLPPIPPKEAPRPDFQRRNTDGSGSLRAADDLLTQVDVLRDSANAARSRRPRFRVERAAYAYDRSNDGSTAMNTTNRRASRLSCGPVPLHEARPGASQLVIDARSPNRTAKNEGSLVDPVHFTGGPDDGRRLQLRYLTPESSSSGSWGSEKIFRKRDKLFRAPVSFFRRFLCFGDFDCTGQFHLVELHTPIPIDRTGSATSSCARFDSLLRSEPVTTRRLHLRPQSSVVSPCVIDIRSN